MNTFLSAEQEAVKQNYLSFSKETIAPVARALESHSTCLKEFLQTIGQKGYLGIAVPREYGGQGQSFINCALFAEAVGTAEPGLGLSLANHYAIVELVKKYGTETQKSRYLPLLARGELIGAIAFSEEKAGTDFRAVTATLATADDGFVLNGKKTWVVNGALGGLALVLAKNEEKNGELTLVLVDCTDKSQSCSDDAKRLGLKSAYLNTVEFSSQKLSKEAQIDSAKEPADKVAIFAMDIAKTILASTAVGLTFAALEKALEFARTREQFGSTIGQFQGIQWKLADMGTEMEAAKLHVLKAAWCLESNPEEFSKQAAMCKWFAGRVARFHTGEAIQVMGAAGLMEDNEVEKLYRDAKAMEICLGTSEAQKMQIVDLLEI